MNQQAFISEWIRVYKANEELFYKYQRNQANLMNSFLTAFPIKEDETIVNHMDVEYVVTNVNFDDLTVMLETNPQQEIFYVNEDNEVLVLDFEAFIELFTQQY